MWPPALARRWKPLAIPPLAITLGFLLWGPERAPSDGGVSIPSPPVAAVSANSSESGAPQPQQRPWPTVDLEQLVRFSPFDELPSLARRDLPTTPPGEPPAPVLPDAAEEQPGTASWLPPSKVDAVYQSPRGIVAVIDSRVVRPGDWLEGGGRVVSISVSGVLVELTPEP